MSLKIAAALRHIHFEDLGALDPVLREAGYRIEYHEIAAGIEEDRLDEADLLVILGGPIGAYDDRGYPFVRDELKILARRLAADRPTLGICLGAQLMARALGSRVYPGPAKEIGWDEIALSDAREARALEDLRGVALLHWHGDTFDLPEGSTLLASTPLYRNQAFARGRKALALQFHPEVTAAGFERWLVGHAHELATAGIDPAMLRAEARVAAPQLELKAAAFFRRWVNGLDP